MRRRRLHISVDLDGIVADLHGRWLELYNSEHGESLTKDGITVYEMADVTKIGGDIYKYLEVPGLYTGLDPLAGSIDALKILNERGHELHILSAASRNPQTAADKLVWCEKHLPFLNRRQITISHQKHRFATDVFIDDAPANIKEHARSQPKAARLSIAWPFNADVEHLLALRAQSYKDTLRAWATMVKFIDDLSEAK